MKTYQFKKIIFEYIYPKFVEEFPNLENKIFRKYLKIDEPDYPYIVMKLGERTRINKRFEKFRKSDKEYVRKQYRIPITFTVCDLQVSPTDAEQYADEVVDFIEQFFIDNQTTHIDLSNRGIVVNELLSSGVRDITDFSETAQVFKREIDIVFEFEDVQIIQAEEGLDLEINILPVSDI